MSAATKRNKPETGNALPPVYVSSIICDGDLVGAAVDGMYSASEFLTGNLSDNDLSFLVPHSNELLRRLNVPGGLLKASEAINILNEKPKDFPAKSNAREEFVDLEKKAAYIISQTGKNRGSSKVWLFSTLQLIEQQPGNQNTNFEEDVLNVITEFLAETKRTCDKDNQNKICVPSTFEDAIKLFDESPAWNVIHHTFDLDSEEKITAFEKLSSFF